MKLEQICPFLLNTSNINFLCLQKNYFRVVAKKVKLLERTTCLSFCCWNCKLRSNICVIIKWFLVTTFFLTLKIGISIIKNNFWTLFLIRPIAYFKRQFIVLYLPNEKMSKNKAAFLWLLTHWRLLLISAAVGFVIQF